MAQAPFQYEELIARVSILDAGPNIGQLPLAGPAPPIPPGGPVPIDLVPLRVPGRPDATLSFHAFMHGDWVDITSVVPAAQWRFGQQIPNRIGRVLRPSDGVLSIDDTDGQFSVFNPNGRFDPNPGVPIEIRAGPSRVSPLEFEGWSKGVQNTTPEVNAYPTIMPIIGPLQFLAEYGEGFFARMDGQPTVSEAFSRVLQEMEWTGLTTIYPSLLKLHAGG